MSIDFIKHTTTSTVRINDTEIPVEIPINPAQGLSGRDDLVVGTGMLFDLDGHPVITMRGMKFSLDIVWISDDKKVVDISRNTLVSVLGNDTLYTPEKPARYALEINAGEAQKHGIKVDADVEINLLPNSDLTRLLVLEEVVEHLAKAVPGESLEYLKPGEKPPKGAQLQRGTRGGRGYYPSEAREAEEEAGVLEAPEADYPSGELVPSSAIDRALADVPSPEYPEDAQEVDVVSPVGQSYDYRGRPIHVQGSENQAEQAEADPADAMLSPLRVNKYFAEVAAKSEATLENIRGGEHQPFLGEGIPLSDVISENIEAAGYTNGSKEGAPRPSGMGIHDNENFTVTIKGQPFIYKHISGENRGEVLAYSIDRALGFNIVPYTKEHSVNPDILKASIEDTQDVTLTDLQNNIFEEMHQSGVGRRAAGHFQEFCGNCVSRDEQPEVMAEMMSTPKGREEFLKIMFIDYLTGNSDRHTGNYLISEDGKMVAIDNGMVGGIYTAHHDQATLALNTRTFGYISFPYGLTDAMENMEAPTREELADEAETFFDKHFDLDKLGAALAPINWKTAFVEGHNYTPMEDNPLTRERFKRRFVEQASENISDAFRPGWNYDSYGAYSSPPIMDVLTITDSKEIKRELAAEGINVEAIHALDFNNQDIPRFRPDLMETPNIYEEDEFN